MAMQQTASRVRWPGAAFARRMARRLCLAASPVFALMALIAAVSGGNEMGCMTGPSPLTGMTTMYLLMSAFHLAPWLRLVSTGFGKDG